MSDIVIDRDYHIGPKPPSLRRRVGTRVLVTVAVVLAIVLFALMSLSAVLGACAQLHCWTL